MENKWSDDAYWSNADKTQIRATRVKKLPDSRTVREQYIINKETDDGDMNKDFASVLRELGEDKIDRNTAERDKIIKEHQERQRENRKAAEETAKTEALFQAKVAAFEIPEVKEATNRTLKAKIRKAKTVQEVNVYAAMLAVDAMINNEKDTE